MSNKVFTEARLKQIAETIYNESSVRVDELAKKYDVSEVTIRADLRKLADNGIVVRTHGGAVLATESLLDLKRKDYEYESRLQTNIELKEMIGKKAASFVEDGQSFFIDDGTTTMQLVKHLDKSLKITVITNGINICEFLKDFENADVIATGGSMSKRDLSFNGKISEQIVRKFFVDKAIIGASSISVDSGVTSPSEVKADLKRAMIERSKQLIVLADHTKLDKTLLYPVCELSNIYAVVTDKYADDQVIDSFREQGVNVVIAG